MKRENEPLWKLVKAIDKLLDAPLKEYGYDVDDNSYYVDVNFRDNNIYHHSAILSFTPLEDGKIEVRLMKWNENGEKSDKISRNSAQFLFNPNHAQIWVNHILA